MRPRRVKAHYCLFDRYFSHLPPQRWPDPHWIPWWGP